MHILIALACFLLGFVAIKYSFPLVRTFGTMAWAERWFGAAGSYTAWKVAGLILTMLGLLILTRPGYFGL